MKGVALSLCRFFSSLSTAHVRGAAPLFSSASHFSIEDEELSFLPTVLSSLQELASFFFWLFLLPSFEEGVSRRFVSASLPLLRPTHSLT